jgi:hypothetical protein
MRVPGFFMQVYYYFAIMKSRHFPIVIFTSIFVFATCSQKQPDQAVQTAQQSDRYTGGSCTHGRVKGIMVAGECHSTRKDYLP